MAKATTKFVPGKNTGNSGKQENTIKKHISFQPVQTHIKAQTLSSSGARNAKKEKVTLKDVQKKAQEMGLLLDALTEKVNIIRAIQIAEGYQSCFGTQVVADCGQMICCWREDCQIHVQSSPTVIVKLQNL